MQFDKLDAAMQKWLIESVQLGCSPDEIQRSLISAGHDSMMVSNVVALAFTHVNQLNEKAITSNKKYAAQSNNSSTPVAADAAIKQTTPGIADDSPNKIVIDDHCINVLFAKKSPRVVYFGNLLSKQECDELISAADKRLTRSTVVNIATGNYDVHPDRTSRGGHFECGETPLITKIEKRISQLLGMPQENGEPIQILHYMPGAEYKPHFDYFEPSDPGNAQVLKMGGQRIATLIIYLNDVEAGGGTIFPEIDVEVIPQKGSAVFFSYVFEDGSLDTRTLHGGSPVIRGEKWIATRWIRQQRFHYV